MMKCFFSKILVHFFDRASLPWVYDKLGFYAIYVILNLVLKDNRKHFQNKN
jgi:hypothetical protein